jgi:hypothetical protein
MQEGDSCQGLSEGGMQLRLEEISHSDEEIIIQGAVLDLWLQGLSIRKG